MARTSKSHQLNLITSTVSLSIVIVWLALFAELSPPSAAETAADEPPSSATDIAAPELAASIREVLRSQQRMWNAGDIDRFMDFYWKSDQLTFSSGGKVTRSWQSTLENYRQRYGARSLMGKLTFRNLEITPLGQTAAYVLGEWQLQRDAEILGGNFTLVFRYLDGRWLIVHDHTSRSEPS